MTKLRELAELGQAIWFDYIRRSFIDSGDLQALIDEGLRGITSNPSIFDNAIAGSTDYDRDIRRLAEEGRSVEETYEQLVLEDIGRAADLLRPVYEQTNGKDGYVSLEVDPNLANDTEGTIADARRLFTALGRRNVMIKVPATTEGIPAVEALIGEGINVNVTLMFSMGHYEATAEAYITGLERLAAGGGDSCRVSSVASFFVSRVESAVDSALQAVGDSTLQGRIAIANAKAVYARFREIFSGERWERLVAQGARVQRPLWASTSTKNPTYPDTLYVDSLIGSDTVNTVPPVTLNAFRERGTVALMLGVGLEEARAQLSRLAEIGVDLDAITQQLQDEGVTKFAQSFQSLMASIAEKRVRLQSGWRAEVANLGVYQARVDDAIQDMTDSRIMARIWMHDHTVWKPEPADITNRLGWLHTAELMLDNVPPLEEFAASVREEDYTQVLLLGMGGSSLAPEVFRKTFGVKEGYLDLAVLDSTDPGAVRDHADRLDPARTLFIVATKSGGTVETLSFFRFFYNWAAEALGESRAGEHFVAITDPGSQLAELAQRHGFRTTFLNDPNIGGRYSALSYFGLVPAALLGVDLPHLLNRSMAMTCGNESCVLPEDNPGARLGAILGELAMTGRDKATFAISPDIASFGDWVEQLIAESTGKDGTGILPVVGEPLGPPEAYGNDRLFVRIRLGDETSQDAALDALEAAGHPVLRLNLRDSYDLGGQFFLWEMAIAVAGHILGINPFNQPNVEAAKVLARDMVAEYTETGVLPTIESAAITAKSLEEFLAQASLGDPITGSGRSYIALQAYVQPRDEITSALAAFRARLRDHSRLATTVGYGPRFLHSTGQLHKGDAGNGLFIQLTADDARDASIPDAAGLPGSSISFGVLKSAQALGDRRALLRSGRRVISFNLGEDVLGGLARLRGLLR